MSLIEAPPSVITRLHNPHIVGFATDLGSWTSHTAILARALIIPAVVGLEGLAQESAPGDPIFLDGVEGVIVYEPTTELIRDYQIRRNAQRGTEEKIHAIRKPVSTLDGKKIQVLANMSLYRRSMSLSNTVLRE